jgi:ABC-type phosphate transport system substrate-binding protein
VTTLSKEAIQNIFLGQQTTWEDGTKIKFAFLQLDPTDKIFLRDYMYYTNTRYIRHWRSQVFSGKGEMPPMLKSDEEMLKFIKENKGSIGFVSSGADTGSVKTLSVK